MLLGHGANGKSTALMLLRALLGDRNVSAVALHALENNPFASADLYGRLANVFADLDARALQSSSTFKTITGGDVLRAERKHRDAFEFVPYARLLFSANQPPPTHDGSQAFFDRWLVLPFDRRIRGTNDEDPDQLAKLAVPQELSGLLNRALAALSDLRARGRFEVTPAMFAAGKRFREHADSVAGFVAECCKWEPGARVGRPALYGSYKAWARDNNHSRLANMAFNARLEQLAANAARPLVLKTVRGTRQWEGIFPTTDAPKEE
jgi:putative DNA primase/helicase